MPHDREKQTVTQPSPTRTAKTTRSVRSVKGDELLRQTEPLNSRKTVT